MKTLNKNQPLYIFMHIPKCAGTTFNYHLNNNFYKEKSIYLYNRHGFYNALKKDYQVLNDRQDIKQYLSSLPDELKNKIRVIFGHDAFYGLHKFFKNRNCRYIVFFREPFKRAVSSYNQKMRGLGLPKDRKISDDLGKIPFQPKIKNIERQNFRIHGAPKFGEWITYKKNKMFEFLAKKGFIKKIKNPSKKDIENMLQKFHFIGLTENFEEDSLLIMNEMGIKRFFLNRNISKKYFDEKKMKKEELAELKKSFYRLNNIDLMIYNQAKEKNKAMKSKINNLEGKVAKLKFKKWLLLPFSEIRRFLAIRVLRL